MGKNFENGEWLLAEGILLITATILALLTKQEIGFWYFIGIPLFIIIIILIVLLVLKIIKRKL